MRKSVIIGLLPSLTAAIALLSVFPAAALVGGAPKANQSIARYVVMVVGSDKTFCSGVVIARDLILTAAQCIHPATSYKVVGSDARKSYPVACRALSGRGFRNRLCLFWIISASGASGGVKRPPQKEQRRAATESPGYRGSPVF